MPTQRRDFEPATCADVRDMLQAIGLTVEAPPVMDVAGWGVQEPTDEQWAAAGFSIIEPWEY